MEAHARENEVDENWYRRYIIDAGHSPSQRIQRKPTKPSSLAVKEVTAPLRRNSITILEDREMSTSD